MLVLHIVGEGVYTYPYAWSRRWKEVAGLLAYARAALMTLVSRRMNEKVLRGPEARRAAPTRPRARQRRVVIQLASAPNQRPTSEAELRGEEEAMGSSEFGGIHGRPLAGYCLESRKRG